MPIFERGDIVRVPFPYTDRDKLQFRPALVVSDGAVGDRGRLLWTAMITSATNRGWPDDIDIVGDRATTGLSAPSVIRAAKLATIEVIRAERLGQIDTETRDRVADLIKSRL